jgi:hypothetical protein
MEGSDMGFLRGCIVLLGLLALLAGCDEQAWADKFVPKQQAALAQDLVARLAARDYDAVEARLDPSVAQPSVRNVLVQMAGLFATGQPRSVKTVGAQTRTMGGVTTYSLTLEYQYPSTWLLANVVLQQKDGRTTVLGLHVVPEAQSLKQANRFTFDGKTPLHYVVLALAIAIPLFILYALVLCIRTPIARRKWLWILFIAVGVAQFSLNWTNGAWSIQPLSLSLLGTGFMRSGPYAPWIFTIALPVGAIVFLARRRKLALS